MSGERSIVVPALMSDEARRVLLATQTTALVMATLSAHAPHLPEHVIKAAAIAAGNASIQRNSQ